MTNDHKKTLKIHMYQFSLNFFHQVVRTRKLAELNKIQATNSNNIHLDTNSEDANENKLQSQQKIYSPFLQNL